MKIVSRVTRFFVLLFFIFLLISCEGLVSPTEPTQPDPSDPAISDPVTYNITVISSENGQISVNQNTASAGQEIVISITPNHGFEIDTIHVTKGTEQVSVLNQRFTMPAGNVSIQVTFKELAIVKYTITIPTIEGVSIELVNEGTSFSAGTLIEVVVNFELLYREVPNTLKYTYGIQSTPIVNRSFIMPSQNIN